VSQDAGRDQRSRASERASEREMRWTVESLEAEETLLLGVAPFVLAVLKRTGSRKKERKKKMKRRCSSQFILHDNVETQTRIAECHAYTWVSHPRASVYTW
jgi:hypothetical protein